VSLPELGLDPDGRLRNDAEPGEVLGWLVEMTAALVSDRPPDRPVQAAVVRLLDPSLRVDRLAGELGFSERQLRRRFRAAVGYGPKTLQRVLRLRRVLARAAASDTNINLATAAFEAGYADQPHLGRECRAMTGLSTRQLIAGV
jgi:transcriptional regulator GlxA family with amidase domain